MANGRPADHPFSDILIYGLHPLPADMEAMIKALGKANPDFEKQFTLEPFEWTRRKALKQGREQLHELCRKNGLNPGLLSARAVLWHYGLYLGTGLFLLGVATVVAIQVHAGQFGDIKNGFWSVFLYSSAPAILGIAMLLRWFKNR